jgi:hypothetical protein
MVLLSFDVLCTSGPLTREHWLDDREATTALLFHFTELKTEKHILLLSACPFIYLYREREQTIKLSFMSLHICKWALTERGQVSCVSYLMEDTEWRTERSIWWSCCRFLTSKIVSHQQKDTECRTEKTMSCYSLLTSAEVSHKDEATRRKAEVHSILSSNPFFDLWRWHSPKGEDGVGRETAWKELTYAEVSHQNEWVEDSVASYNISSCLFILIYCMMALTQGWAKLVWILTFSKRKALVLFKNLTFSKRKAIVFPKI